MRVLSQSLLEVQQVGSGSRIWGCKAGGREGEREGEGEGGEREGREQGGGREMRRKQFQVFTRKYMLQDGRLQLSETCLT